MNCSTNWPRQNRGIADPLPEAHDRDLARSAAGSLNLPAESILVAARDSALRAEFGITAPTVRGGCTPNLFFGAFDGARQVVRRFWRPK